MATLGGHQGELTIGASDLYDGYCDVEIYEWTFQDDGSLFESTAFAATPPKSTAWVPGLPAFRGHARGFVPAGVTFPATGVVATSAFSAGRATSTLSLRHQDATTDYTISGEAQIYNVAIGVTIQGGAPLNTLEFDYQFDAVPAVAGT